MKQKISVSKPATKKDITLLGNELKVLESTLRADIKLNRGEILVQVDENAQRYRDQILTSNDKLAKTLETIREELEIGSFQVRKQINNHEERIKNLEKIPQTA